MRNHSVAPTKGVLSVTKWVVFGCWLREPDISSIAAEVVRLEGFGDVFFYDDGAAGGVDEP